MEWHKKRKKAVKTISSNEIQKKSRIMEAYLIPELNRIRFFYLTLWEE